MDDAYSNLDRIKNENKKKDVETHLKDKYAKSARPKRIKEKQTSSPNTKYKLGNFRSEKWSTDSLKICKIEAKEKNESWKQAINVFIDDSEGMSKLVFLILIINAKGNLADA